MRKDGLIQANLSVIFSIVVLLAFADDIVGDFQYEHEKSWLNSTRYLIGLVFLFSALGLFPTMASYYLPEKISSVVVKWSNILLVCQFLVLFFILTRFLHASIFGI